MGLAEDFISAFDFKSKEAGHAERWRDRGAGRRKGSGKDSSKLQGRQQFSLARSEGMTLLEYLLAVMTDPNQDLAHRDRAAQAAAPYVHARLAPRTAGPDEIQGSDKATEAEWTEFLVN